MIDWPWKMEKDTDNYNNYILKVENAGTFTISQPDHELSSPYWTVQHEGQSIADFGTLELEKAMAYCERLAVKLGGKKPSQYDLDVEL